MKSPNVRILIVTLVVFIGVPFVRAQDESTHRTEAIASASQAEMERERFRKPKKQATASPSGSNKRHELSVWGGFSPRTTTALGWGSSEGARFGLGGFRWAYRFEPSGSLHLKHIVDIPFAFLDFPIVDRSREPSTGRRTGYALGVAPLGLQANFAPKGKLQPFVGGNAGFLYFNEDIPNPRGKRFNFTIEFGSGVEIMLNKEKTKSLTIGYKLYHISNFYRGVSNPGFDNLVFFLGYRFFSR